MTARHVQVNLSVVRAFTLLVDLFVLALVLLGTMVGLLVLAVVSVREMNLLCHAECQGPNVCTKYGRNIFLNLEKIC